MDLQKGTPAEYIIFEKWTKISLQRSPLSKMSTIPRGKLSVLFSVLSTFYVLQMGREGSKNEKKTVDVLNGLPQTMDSF